jgi:transcriptional regulator with XRE-family HTH domain
MKPAVGKFGIRLRELRVQRGLGLNALGRLACMDPAYPFLIECKNRKPSREAVEALAKALELDNPETDRFLYLAGYAPVRDWQSLAEKALKKLDRIVGILDNVDDLEFIRKERVS